MTTYTNLGIKQIDTGDEAGTWGVSTNTNFDYFDKAIVGYSEVTLTTAGSTGAPNLLEVLDYAPSAGRSRIIEFKSAADLGGNAYVQISPNDFQGYYFVRNSLPGARSVILFQGNWDSARDFELTADAVVFCSGTGSTSTVKNILEGLQVSAVVSGDITGETITATDGFSGPGTGLTGTATTLNIGGNAATSTSSTNVAVTNDISSSGVFYPSFVINTTGNQGIRTSSTKLTYQPSTGTFTATALSGTTGTFATANITTGNITNLTVSGATPTFSGTGAIDIPVGTTAQRPSSPSTGMIRYNTTTSAYEVYTGAAWVNLATGSGGGLGVGQSWYSYTMGSGGQRQLEVTYTNSTSSPIAVIYTGSKVGSVYSSGTITGVVNGTNVVTTAIAESTVGEWYGLTAYVSIIVPAGQTYRVDSSLNVSTQITNNIWAELR